MSSQARDNYCLRMIQPHASASPQASDHVDEQALAGAAACYKKHGYTIVRGLWRRAVVADLQERVHRLLDEYALDPQPRGSSTGLLKVRAVFGSRFAEDAAYIAHVREHPRLRRLFEASDASPQLQHFLQLVLRSGNIRFLQRNELLMNHRLTWHRDALQSHLRAYTNTLDPWLVHGRPTQNYTRQHPIRPIATVAIFLEDHVDDRMGLAFSDSSHVDTDSPMPAPPGRCSGAPPAAHNGRGYNRTWRECQKHVVVSSRAGDAVVFDTLTWHRSGMTLWNSSFRADGSWRTGPQHRRLLLTLSYGAPSAFSDAYEHAMRMRNRLLTDASLCKLTLESACARDAGKLARRGPARSRTPRHLPESNRPPSLRLRRLS